MDTAIITYLYPNAIKYFDEFTYSINNQSNKDFDCIIFLDNVPIPNEQILHNTITYNLSGRSPSEIRFISFEILRNLNYSKYIFIDSDDTMSHNRVEILTQELDKYSLVCNDLNLMDSDGTIFERSIWENRYSEDFDFDYQFLINKNIVGFGSVGIRNDLLKNHLDFHPNPIASDWFYFFQILANSNAIAHFTSKCQTNYRQHTNNDAGMDKISMLKIPYVIKVKMAQYKSLFEIGFEFFLDNIEKLKKVEDGLDKLVLSNKNENFPFWWEETEYLYEKN